jgi:hypothetical protein
MASTKPSNTSAFTNIIVNIAIPSIVLMKLSAPERLGPVYALVLALCFPLGFGIWELIRSGKPSFFAALGLVNVMLTGGLGLMKMDGFWFAVKEAAVPLVLGAGVLVSLKTKSPIVRSILLNEHVINVPLVRERLEQSGRNDAFEKLMTSSTVFLAFSFFLSALLNFGLARYLLVSPSGTPEFNDELGRMTALSFPVIAVPSLVVTGLVIWRLFAGIKGLTGLGMDQIFHDQAKAAAVQPPKS